MGGAASLDSCVLIPSPWPEGGQNPKITPGLQVAKQCQALVDLKVLAASDSVEAFVLSYSSLLEGAPGVTPALLERLVTARPDIARTDVKEVRAMKA